MKYIHENFVTNDEIDTAENRGFVINVRFCRECPLFEYDGIQPDPDIGRGWCRRFSDEDVPHYVRVTDRDFCNEDRLEEYDLYT